MLVEKDYDVIDLLNLSIYNFDTGKLDRYRDDKSLRDEIDNKLLSDSGSNGSFLKGDWFDYDDLPLLQKALKKLGYTFDEDYQLNEKVLFLIQW
tara:strand:- start:301 stop:582 length:282 start_codon:yes stop_codon:yes gene_type:complete